jgi:uncharacterized repeat protein (TIGR01451 family)
MLTAEGTSAMAFITMVKTDSTDPAFVGSPLQYEYHITNLGPDPAIQIELTDQLPATVQFVTANLPCARAGNVLTCFVGDLAVGASFDAIIEVRAQEPRMITNVALAVGTNTNAVQAIQETQILQPVTIEIRKSATPDPAFVGGLLTYTVEVVNLSIMPAVDVVLTDALPNNADFVAASVPCALQTATNGLFCTLGTIPPLSTVTVLIQVRPLAVETVVATAIARGVNTNQVTIALFTDVILAADLAVTKTANPRAQVGQGLTYTVTVTNNGPSDAPAVELVETLPRGARFISATPSQGSCEVGFGLTCLLGTVPAGASATVTVLVVPTQPGCLTNTARVSSAAFDPDLENNTATLTTKVTQCFVGEC